MNLRLHRKQEQQMTDTKCHYATLSQENWVVKWMVHLPDINRDLFAEFSWYRLKLHENALCDFVCPAC